MRERERVRERERSGWPVAGRVLLVGRQQKGEEGVREWKGSEERGVMKNE